MSPQTSVDVTFVMPILNEEHYVRAAVDSILAQAGVNRRQILLVRGRSTDGTDDIIDALAAEEPDIQVIENPGNGISIALNLGFEAAAHDVVVRVDAHSMLPVDYTARMVAALREAGAANVGGRMKAEGVTPFQRAVAWAYNSRVGLGGGVYHTGDAESGPAESAYLGVFDRAAVLDIGGFDPELLRGEDWELNHRLITSGRRVWFVPGIEVAYRPRASLRSLLKQFFASGQWRGELIRRIPGNMGSRYIVPPLLVLGVAAGLVLAAFAGVLGAWAVVGLAPLGAYAVVIIASAAAARGEARATRACLLLVLPAMHFSWGAGCLLGLLRPSRRLSASSGR